MNLNAANLFLPNQYDYLGYGSGVAGLFSGVSGLNSVWNFGGSNYMNYTGTCSGGSNFNWGALVGMVTVGFFGMLTAKGIQVHNTNKSERKAAEQKAATDFNSALKTLGLQDKDVAKLTEGDIDKVGIGESVLKELHKPVETAENKVKELETQKTTDMKKCTNIDANLKPEGCESNDIDVIISAWQDYIDSLEAGKAYTKADDAIKQLKELKSLKESWDEGGANYKKLENAKNAKESAVAKEKEEIAEKEKIINDAQKIAKEHLSEQQAKIKAEKSRELNEKIDNADGNWVSRMGKNNFTVGDGGAITKNGDLTPKDIRKLGYLYRTGTSAQKAKIKEFVKNNEQALLDIDKLSDDEITMINSIANS